MVSVHDTEALSAVALPAQLALVCLGCGMHLLFYFVTALIKRIEKLT
jgi:hypothetical protein